MVQSKRYFSNYNKGYIILDFNIVSIVESSYFSKTINNLDKNWS